MSELAELAAAMRIALELPPAETLAADTWRYQVMCDRVACVLANLDHLASGDSDRVQLALARLGAIPEDVPVDYAVAEPQR